MESQAMDVSWDVAKKIFNKNDANWDGKVYWREWKNAGAQDRKTICNQ